MSTALEVFREVNEEVAQGRKFPLERRYEIIREQFPSVVDLDWKAAFDRSPELWHRILNAIGQLGQITGGRSGPRPEPDVDRAIVDLRRLMGEEYATLPFHVVFTILADRRSLTQLGRKVGMDRMRVLRLKRNDRPPNIWEMEQIADAFGKHPSFFMEYRTAMIAGAIISRVEASPETSVHVYRKLVGAML